MLERFRGSREMSPIAICDGYPESLQFERIDFAYGDNDDILDVQPILSLSFFSTYYKFQLVRSIFRIISYLIFFSFRRVVYHGVHCRLQNPGVISENSVIR